MAQAHSHTHPDNPVVFFDVTIGGLEARLRRAKRHVSGRLLSDALLRARLVGFAWNCSEMWFQRRPRTSGAHSSAVKLDARAKLLISTPSP